MPPLPFSSLSAAERAASLVDPGSLRLAPGGSGERAALLAGRGRIAGRPVSIALTDGRQRGGTLGVAEARRLSRLVVAADRRSEAVVVCWDTGGVRVQDGPAALAAASAAGVALARLALRGVPVGAVITGPRGCFGAPAVIAGAAQATILTADAHWGLTGPRLLDAGTGADAAAVMSAAYRLRAGHASAVVADTPEAIRDALAAALSPRRPTSAARVLDTCLATAERLLGQLGAPEEPVDEAPPAPPPRRRDFLTYSFRGQWRPTGPAFRGGHVDAAWGELAGHPALAVIVGPDRSHDGIGVEDAHAVLRALRFAAAASRRAPAPVLTFLFCRGHASTVRDERAGLPCALAACLTGLVAARRRGHPLLCVLGGGAYGAAYLALAAPSHRVLAIRGTAVAPMAPRVQAAFDRLSGVRHAPDTPPDLAKLLPEIRLVDSVVRLPRILTEELAAARRATAAEVRRRGPAKQRAGGL